MAKRYDHILQHLGDYKLTPPASHFEKIWESIQSEQPVSKQGPSEDDSTFEQQQFSALKDHTIPAPEFELLHKKLPLPNNKKNRIFQLPYLLRTAAAILVAIIAGWIVYLVAGNKNTVTPQQIAHQSKAGGPAEDNTKDRKKDGSYDSSDAQRNVLQNQYAGTKQVHLNNQYSQTIAFGNSEFKLLDNDLLFTLTNFSYRENRNFMSNLDANRRVVLDKYSYLSISEKMYAVMEKANVTKRNKKPTRKAKRIKAKVVKWKKKDAAYFDNGNKNPLDIIDLSEFILK